MKSTNLISLSAILIFSLFITSCEDDSVSSQEEHFKAIGTVIYEATGAIAVSVLRGETSDTLYIKNGELSDHFDVKFYDENENIIEPPTNEHTSLNHELGDDSIIEFWQHEGEEGGYEFHLRGLKAGVTTLELLIEHEGHNDYRSGKVPVVVQ